MSDFFLVEPPIEVEELSGDVRPAQPTLFTMYHDKQRSKGARHVEPSLMDWLADNPRE
jgi:hypothetical protein